jgi:transposase
MQDHQLYQQILWIGSPWRVARVEMDADEGAIHVYVEHRAEQRWPCPECGSDCRAYGHQAERRWRHLDTCQYRTILHASPSRSEFSEHGVRVVKLPWAEPSSRFTALFERLVIDWLKAASQKAVARNLHLSQDEIHRIIKRAVERGLRRRKAEPVRLIGVDEKAFRRGHRYLTLVNDLERGRVLYVAEDRKQSSLDGLWPTLTDDHLHGVDAIAMDMWEPYVASTNAHLPDAGGKIVFDQFHIAGHLGDAVDKVRREENRELRRHGDVSLVGTKYDWLRHPARFSSRVWRSFRQLRDSTLRTARAWALKEAAMVLFLYRYPGAARNFFKRWYSQASRCRLTLMVLAARMIRDHLDNILTFIRHRITNAARESINSKIQWVKYTAERSPQGFFADELADALHAEVHDVLRRLTREGGVSRTEVDGRYLYTAADSHQHRRQLRIRRTTGAVPVAAEVRAVQVSPDELQAAVLLFYSLLDEQQRRLYAGLESLRLGHGGDTVLADFLALEPRTVARGRQQLLDRDVAASGRTRRSGGGRVPTEKKRPKSSPSSKTC